MENKLSKEKIAWLVEEFKWFHAHPEISYEEVNTTARLRENLTKLGIKILDLPLKTGLVAQIGAEDNAPVAVLRADIDALPVTEQTDLSYKSVNKGKMHACGHDFHMSSLLGAAMLLKEDEERLKGALKIVFQLSEENPGGALKIIDTGALDDAQVIFGIHSSPVLDVGETGISAGAVTASVDKFVITFFGRGTHAAHPEEGVDPVFMAAQFVNAAQTIRTQNISPFAPNIVGVTKINTDNLWNVVPEKAVLEGTVRSLSVADRKLIKERIVSLAQNIGAAFGGASEIVWGDGAPPTDNDVTWTEFAARTAQKKGLCVVPAPHTLIGEDFAYYQEKIPGVFALFGTGKSSALHSSTFCVKPEALPLAAEYLAELGAGALKILNQS